MFTPETIGENGGLPATARESVVDVAGVTKRYRSRAAVAKLTLTVRPGEVLGLVGANGVGKTTTLRILAGILKPDEGHGQVLGFDLLRGANLFRERVGYMSQRSSLYASLSVFENLRFRAEVYRLDRPKLSAEAAILDFGLTEYARSAAGQLSGGWTRQLQLAAALIHSPRLILLDEPTAGLDAKSRHAVWGLISRLAGAGAGIIISTHDLAEAERCSRAALLSEGRVVASGTPEQIVRSSPAFAFVVSGTDARLLAPVLEAVPGVITSYPHGPSLRVIANSEAAEALRRVVTGNNARIASVAMRLEDAVLAFSSPATTAYMINCVDDERLHSMARH
jgi:ABC-2 type transport system ATP-binding protein